MSDPENGDCCLGFVSLICFLQKQKIISASEQQTRRVRRKKVRRAKEVKLLWVWAEESPHLVSGPSLPSQRSDHSWWPLLSSTASCCRDDGGPVDAGDGFVFRLSAGAPRPASLLRLPLSPLLLLLTELLSLSLPPSLSVTPSLLLLLLLLCGCCGFLQLFSLGGNGGRERRRKAGSGQRRNSLFPPSHHFLPPHLLHSLPALLPPLLIYMFLPSGPRGSDHQSNQQRCESRKH